MSERSTIRIFVSSPSDVRPERLIAERVIKRLAREFAYRFDVTAILWEREPLLATSDFQTLITPPSQTDIVIVILWSRLGVVLPEPAVGRLSGRPVTGTEYEFEDAFAGFRERHLPHLLLYRKQADVTVKLGDRAQVEEQQRQSELVEEFMLRWTRDAEGKAFTAAHWPFGDGAAFEAMVEDHLRGLLQQRTASVPQASGGATPTVRWHQGSPFRGLEAFEPEHEQIFFGRTRARNELREVLNRQMARGEAFVLVVGASGSGKSSLVKAGLLPELRLPGMMPRVGLVRDAITRPGAGNGPIEALAEAILAALPELAADPLSYDRAHVIELLRDAPPRAVHAIRQGLTAAGRAAGLTSVAEARLLLVIDQLEELLTIEGVGDEQRERYVEALRALAASGLVLVVATMRSDFFARLERLPSLARLAVGEATYFVAPPDTGEFGQIVRQPAREAGLAFEMDAKTGQGLDEAILAAASDGAGSLPLLEYLLDQLFARRGTAGILTFEAYRSLGGLEGAIGARAEEVLASLPADVQAALPTVLRALVTVGEGADAGATARYAARDRFAETSAPGRLIAALLAPGARLLVADGGTIRVAHEALLTHWERARRQIAEDRSDLQLRARLEQAAMLWREAAGPGRDSLLLAEGLPLSQAEDLLNRRGDEIEPGLIEYVESSAGHVRRRRRRGTRRLIYVSATLGVLTLFASLGVVASVFAIRESSKSYNRAEASLSEGLKLVDIVIDELNDVTLDFTKVKRLIHFVEESLVAIAKQEGEDRVKGTRTRLYLSVVDDFLAADELDEAEKYADLSLKAAEDLGSRDPEHDVYRSWLASAWSNVAKVREKRGNLEGAIEAVDLAIRIGRHAVKERKDDEVRDLRRLGDNLDHLARLREAQGEEEPSDRALADAIEARVKLIMSPKSAPLDRTALAATITELGVRLEGRGKEAEAVAVYKNALEAEPLEAADAGDLVRIVARLAVLACARDEELETCQEAVDVGGIWLGLAEGKDGKPVDFDDISASLAEAKEKLAARTKK